MITNKFDYPELKRVNNNLGRFYIDSDSNHVPSVTTILNNISDKKASIDQWRMRVGDDEADRVMKEATDIGSMVHESLENYLNKSDHNIFTNDSIGIMAKGMSQKLIDDALNSISEVYGLEVHLVLNDLYAGTADCIGVIDGEETIIDFKTSKRIKKKEWIDDYFLQGCAYANAHNVMFNTNIKQVAILMVDRDLIYKKFLIKDNEFNHFTKLWKQKLLAFHNKFTW
ncbi:MAG: preprotein translocase subunit TatA [Gammaproteobacteria bacterium]|tara:strand:- start:5735 stop:6415 length:681 start_codon:yes stop_codon:yes gene_type:complete